MNEFIVKLCDKFGVPIKKEEFKKNFMFNSENFHKFIKLASTPDNTQSMKSLIEKLYRNILGPYIKNKNNT